jgi:hypothetical protein
MSEKNNSQLNRERGHYSQYEQFQRRVERLTVQNPELSVEEITQMAREDVTGWKEKQPRYTYDCWHPYRKK